MVAPEKKMFWLMLGAHPKDTRWDDFWYDGKINVLIKIKVQNKGKNSVNNEDSKTQI